MKPEDFKAKTTEILSNLTDQAKVSTILAELTADYDNVAVETNTAKTTAEKLTEDNEKLRQANMQLFLKVGEPKKETEIKQTEETKLSYKNLFDENGNLK